MTLLDIIPDPVDEMITDLQWLPFVIAGVCTLTVAAAIIIVINIVKKKKRQNKDE